MLLIPHSIRIECNFHLSRPYYISYRLSFRWRCQSDCKVKSLLVMSTICHCRGSRARRSPHWAEPMRASIYDPLPFDLLCCCWFFMPFAINGRKPIAKYRLDTLKATHIHSTIRSNPPFETSVYFVQWADNKQQQQHSQHSKTHQLYI